MIIHFANTSSVTSSDCLNKSCPNYMKFYVYCNDHYVKLIYYQNHYINLE
ncbi:hypothetical protein HanXRQr2_Chr08g0328071 [Helianthus annuus]|uniref:Uncharacterized protein n=1 Tax=Helianthus annuus TaxID=4232 RepID=A0A9K3NCG8_HELAN|nr:hypothetical protein HanXRQr2_Chr08g0328071 [Helianthus annuus]